MERNGDDAERGLVWFSRVLESVEQLESKGRVLIGLAAQRVSRTIGARRAEGKRTG